MKSPPHPFTTGRRFVVGLAMLVCLVACPWVTRAQGPPRADAATTASRTTAIEQLLQFEGPERRASLIARLKALDGQALHDMADLLGLDPIGGPIRVRLVDPGSDEAALAPRWAVAYAIGNASLVVLIPSRVPSYPDDDLETVLYHEVAHVFVARAAGRRPVPRWFNEGVAMVAARENGPSGWGLGDQGRLLLATLRRDGSQLAKMEQGFGQGPQSAAAAYSLAAAFVRHLQSTYGPYTIADILAQVRQGHSFEAAFRQVTGTSLYLAEETFWHQLDVSHKWVPFLTSSATLWTIITLLALWAFRRRRMLDAERLAAWEEEEQRQLALWEPPEETIVDDRTGPWIH